MDKLMVEAVPVVRVRLPKALVSMLIRSMLISARVELLYSSRARKISSARVVSALLLPQFRNPSNVYIPMCAVTDR